MTDLHDDSQVHADGIPDFCNNYSYNRCPDSDSFYVCVSH